MGEVLTESLVDTVRVVAFDVLPRIALLAVNRVSIIVSKSANTLDSVWLFIYNLLLSGDILYGYGRRQGEWNPTRRRDRRRERWQLVCHNLKGTSRWRFNIGGIA